MAVSFPSLEWCPGGGLGWFVYMRTRCVWIACTTRSTFASGFGEKDNTCTTQFNSVSITFTEVCLYKSSIESNPNACFRWSSMTGPNSVGPIPAKARSASLAREGLLIVKARLMLEEMSRMFNSLPSELWLVSFTVHYRATTEDVSSLFL